MCVAQSLMHKCMYVCASNDDTDGSTIMIMVYHTVIRFHAQVYIIFCCCIGCVLVIKGGGCGGRGG